MAHLRDTLKKTLKEVAIKENIKDYDVEIQELSTEGASNTSALYSAKIISRNRADIDLFAKVASSSESVCEQFVKIKFETERFIYHDLAKIYNDIQEKYKVPEDERFVFPKMYASNTNEMEEIIVLENLVSQGYTMYDRFKPIHWEFASKAVDELAKFHALSFAYQKENVEEFQNLESKFDMTKTMAIELFKTAFASNAAATLPLVPESIKVRLQKFIEDLSVNFTKYYGPAQQSVITHGDYRASNILFKRQAGKVKTLIPVDYQTVRLASPCTDLLYFIYSGSDDEFRRLHMKHLLDHYYATLSKFLIMFEMDPEAVYSRSNFGDDFIDFLSYGLSTTLFLLPNAMEDPFKVPKMAEENVDVTNYSIRPTDAFKKRFLDIVYEFIDLGML